MDPLRQFLWGAAGSLAVEVVNLSRIFASGRPIPKKFRSTGYWGVRLALALVAGLVAVAFQAQAPIFAMQFGAATPLLVDSWAKRRPRIVLPSSQSK